MKNNMMRLIAMLLTLALLMSTLISFAETAEETSGENPVVATVPDAAESPKTTEEHEVPTDPEVTDEPETTDDPEANTEPEETVGPEETAEPEATADPEVTVEPETIVEPEVTVESEETIEPEETVEPEATEETETIVDPEMTEEPETDVEPMPIDESAEDELTTSPVDNSTTLPDGEYVPTNCTGGSSKVSFSCPKVTVQDGKAMAMLVISSSKYDYIKAGGGQYETAAYADGGVYVNIPIDLNADNRIVGHTTAMGGKEIEYTVHIALDETSAGEPTPETTPETTKEPVEDTEHTVETDNKMFKIIRSVLTLKDGQYTAQITLSGTGYDKLYCGTAEQAAADSANWISYSGEYNYEDAGEEKTGYVFNIPVSAVNQPIPVAAHSVKKDEWMDRNVTFTVAIAETTPEPTEEPGEDTEHSVETDNKMFKIIRSMLTQKDGQYAAEITLSGTGYDKLYCGTAEQAANDSANWISYSGEYNYEDEGEAKTGYVFNIPVSAVNQPIPVAAHSVKKDEWMDRNVTFTVEVIEPTPVPEENIEHTVETDNKMFKIIRSVLTQKDGQYTAQITLSGTGYDILYCGIAEQAANDSTNWISYSGEYNYEDEGEAKTGYVFNIPVSAVNQPIPVAAHSVKKDEWMDRNVTFTVAVTEPTPIPDSGEEPTATPAPSPTPAPTPVILGTPGKVNSSTSLKDGTYTPDKFSWSGGSGRTSISCSKVTVKNGEAYAIISFSSDSYAYVKASGSKYYGSVVDGRSTFEIPVNLNTNNKIVGMTTAMSADHEIEYTIYVYIAGAKDSANTAESTQAEQAAQIIGLNYVSADTIEYGKLFKVYRYEGGCTAIDVVNVGKYLVVPEDAELPVGIDEEAVIIRRPILSVHSSSENALEMLQMIIGDDPEPEITVAAWDYTAPDYTTLLLNACDLAIMPEIFAEPDEGEEPLTEEVTAAIADVHERLDMLGIPMFVDRSADEETEAAKLEWIKVYGILLGCEEAANTCYETAVAALEVQA